ncbi:hypothetical protein LPN01_14310 [Sphingomonas sp. A2-49]|uniref:hypothetical protein n=1 Tax=Sphingomonas sp. A2-49 TaxID=1391375 RepID=UPI0021D35BB2|nr:hypothetical protein [Sphingomonas sp. A2-49]MCU6455255.1 hypothetical protein [Sphingomonas sp. A2-49]
MDTSEIQREIAAAQRIALYLDDRVSTRAIERYLAELHTRRLFTACGARRPAFPGGRAGRQGPST